jgi:hypothetical protein
MAKRLTLMFAERSRACFERDPCAAPVGAAGVLGH